MLRLSPLISCRCGRLHHITYGSYWLCFFLHAENCDDLFRKFTIRSGIKLHTQFYRKGRLRRNEASVTIMKHTMRYIVSVLCALTLAVFMSIAVSAWDNGISVTVFGTKYPADSTDSPDTDSYSVEYKDDAIVITLNNLDKTITITEPFIESTSATPIKVELIGNSIITAASADETYPFIKSKGDVTITSESIGELTIVPAVDGQQLADGGSVTNNAVVNFKCPDAADDNGISFELGAGFTIEINSTITLDNNFTLVVDGTEFTAESAPSGTSSWIRCAGEGPCRGIIDIRGNAEAVFYGKIGDKNMNGDNALERHIQIRLSEGNPNFTLANPEANTSIGNVGFSIQAGKMTLGSPNSSPIFLDNKSVYSKIDVSGSGQLIIASNVQMKSQTPYITLNPVADCAHSPLVVQFGGMLDNQAIITGVSGCEQPLILVEEDGELHNYNNGTIRLQVGGDTEDTSTLIRVKDGGTLKLASPNTNQGKLCVIDKGGHELDSIGYTLVSAEDSSDVEFGNDYIMGSTQAGIDSAVGKLTLTYSDDSGEHVITIYDSSDETHDIPEIILPTGDFTLDCTLKNDAAPFSHYTINFGDEDIIFSDLTSHVASIGERTGPVTFKAISYAERATSELSFNLTVHVKTEEPENPVLVPDPNPINITQPSNGTVSTNLSNASAGATITVTATPNSGYELAYVTVNGEKIGGNTFTMPDEAVTVSAVFVPATGGFADVVPGAWYYDAVSYVYAHGLMDGVSATQFAPDANMTRAMLVTILWRVDGQPVVNYLLPFTDVPGDTWYTEAVRWAASEGIVSGVSASEFAPNAEITREQLAAILWRYAGEPEAGGGLSAFADAAQVSAYAVNAMSWCVEQGIITGTTETTLAPQGTATRAQCATMLMRFMER